MSVGHSVGNRAIEYDPWSRVVSDDPYPYFRTLRAQSPVHYIPSRGLWVITRYDDVAAALRDTETFSSSFLYMKNPFMAPTIEELEAEYGPAPERRPDVDPNAQVGDTKLAQVAQLTPALIEKDGAGHARERQLVRRMFTPRAVAEMEPFVRALCDELFDTMAWEVRDKGASDYKGKFCWPLSVKVTAQLMSISDDDASYLARLAEDSLGLFALDPRRRKASEWAYIPYARYFQLRHEAGTDDRDDSANWDLVRRLQAPDANGDRLTAEQIVSNAAVLFRAGFETTANVLANIVRLLDIHRDQLDHVRSDMALVPMLVEETMRYEAPAQGLFRVTTRDVELHDAQIPAGSIVQLMFASANRDESHFEQPDAYRVTRANSRDQLGFGHGPHLCIGAELARMEMRVATEVFLSRARHFRVVGDVPLYRHVIIRGPESVPITFSVD
jgi:hypothetical protein